MDNLNEDTSRRTVLNSLTSNLKTVHKKAQRAKLLSKCMKHKVCPQTLALRAPQNGASKSKDIASKFKKPADLGFIAAPVQQNFEAFSNDLFKDKADKNISQSL